MDSRSWGRHICFPTAMMGYFARTLALSPRMTGSSRHFPGYTSRWNYSSMLISIRVWSYNLLALRLKSSPSIPSTRLGNSWGSCWTTYFIWPISPASKQRTSVSANSSCCSKINNAFDQSLRGGLRCSKRSKNPCKCWKSGNGCRIDPFPIKKELPKYPLPRH